MEVLFIIGFVVLVGYIGYQWVCYDRMRGKIDRMVKDNSKIIMDEINKNK